MIKKKIICYKLKHPDLKLLAKKLNSFQHLELSEINSLEDIQKENSASLAGIFVYVDEAISQLELENLFKIHRGISKNIILKYKNFDLLMLCYRYQSTSVFEKQLQENYLERVLIQIDLLGREESADLPIRQVVELFSSPVKIKKDQDLYGRLAAYFKQFEAVKSFCLISVGSDYVSRLGGQINYDWDTIKFPRMEKDFIGKIHQVTHDGQNLVLCPLFKGNQGQLWMALEITDEKKDFILNHLLFKYLENVHIYRMNKEKEHNLQALATTDDVTGLYNQRKLSQDLMAAVEYHEKNHKNFSIMFIDVDHFKNVNDSFGHVIGSQLLIDIGEVLTQLLRSSDDIYRYGGDEFVVIMPSVKIDTVHEIATRILKKIKSKKFDIGEGKEYQLSVSIGIAEYPTDATDAKKIIQFADEMMYKSKESGRGKVFHINEV